MAKYISRIKHLRIVITPGNPIYEGGNRVGDKPGKSAKFENGVFETKDKEIIEKLESLPTFGFDFSLMPENEVKEPEAPKDELELKTKKELLAMAEEKGIKVDGNPTKNEIINLLKA